MSEHLIDAIDDVLPQTQCRQCGYNGCRNYAWAIAMGEAPINRCAPGGQKGIEALAKVTGHEVIALDPEYGHEVPLELAHINPDTCIGCRKCVAVCPTNAILGAPKRLHGVISDWCTGCALCVTACPVDCIDMRPAPFEWTHEKALKARRLYREKLQREKLAYFRAVCCPKKFGISGSVSKKAPSWRPSPTPSGRVQVRFLSRKCAITSPL